MEINSPSDDEGFNALTAKFAVWLKNISVNVSNKIKLEDCRHRSAGRAVIATQDISADEELFSIPRSSVLTVETSDLPADVKAKLDDPWLSLIVAMIFEYQRGKQSKWKPYLDVLPYEFDTLMYWTEDDLKHLAGSAVVGKIGRQTADEAFTEHILPLTREHPALLNGASLDDNGILRLCHRMASTMMAYAFDLECATSDHPTSRNAQDGWEEASNSDDGSDIFPKGMVPLADMLNADADSINAKLFYEDDKVVMKAIKDVQAGEELFNDYGPLPSADVLRRYGYVTSNYAKYDVVEVEPETIKSVAKQQLKIQEKELEARTAYLDDCGILDDGYDIARQAGRDGQFPEELCALLNALTMAQEDFDKLRKKEKLPKPELTRPALELLYAVLVQRRSPYPPGMPTLAESNDQSTRRRKMAEQVIAGEKRVLQEAAESVQERLNEGKKRKADTFGDEAKALRTSNKEAKTS